MIKRLLPSLSLLFFSYQSDAQVWSYNFGTLVDSITSGTATSPVFLPATADGSSSAYARIGTGGGKVVLKSYPGIGSGSSLRLQAPTGGSINKFSLYGIASASTTLGLKLTFSLADSMNSATPVTSGTFYFFAGNGTTYSNANTFTGNQVFSGIRMVLGASSAAMSVRVPVVGWYSDPTNPITVPYGVPLTVALYMNSGTTAVNYTDINGMARSLPAGTCDLFSNGTYLSNIPNAGLPSSTVLNSFMFYAENATGNLSNVFIDDIVYTNNIVANTLPLHLNSFIAKPDNNNMQLSWETGVETDMNYFSVERSANGNDFKEIGTVYCKHSNGSIYSFTDEAPMAVNYYRLRIMKTNGDQEFSPIVMARMNNRGASVNAWYANAHIYVENQRSGTEMNVYDLSGRKVFTTEVKDTDRAIDLSELHPGNYIASIKSGEETYKVKFIKE